MPPKFSFQRARSMGPLGFAACLGVAWASGVHAREYQNLFATPKALSMGEAVTALADDYTALQYNAAGLTLIEKWQLRAPDLATVQASSGIRDFKSALGDAKDNPSEPVAKKLQRFDGQNASVGFDVLGLAYLRNGMGLAINPLSVNMSVRLRTPSLLFAKANVRLLNDTGLAIGLARPFFNNHFRLGLTLRPFIWRTGFDRKIENQDLVDIFGATNTSSRLKGYMGSGWGYDADVGAQANANPIRIFGAAVKPMAGVVFQNSLGNKFSNRVKADEYTGEVPPLERKLNAGVAASIVNSGVVRPTLSFEIRDIFVRTNKFIEHVSAGMEILLKPKTWFSTAFRGHFYKGNVGGGVGVVYGPAELELGTYAVNLGNGPGIGVSRRYYTQLSLVF